MDGEETSNNPPVMFPRLERAIEYVTKGHYASFVQRWVAFEFDWFIITALVFILSYPARYVFPAAHFNRVAIQNWLLIPYFIAFELSPMQATPAKRMIGFFIGANDGSRLSWWRVILRNILRFACLFPIFCRLPPSNHLEPVSALVLVSLLIGNAIFSKCDPRRRMLHDVLASSVAYTQPLSDESSPRHTKWIPST